MPSNFFIGQCKACNGEVTWIRRYGKFFPYARMESQVVKVVTDDGEVIDARDIVTTDGLTEGREVADASYRRHRCWQFEAVLDEGRRARVAAQTEARMDKGFDDAVNA